MEMIDFLESVDLFHEVAKDHIGAVVPCCEKVNVTRGDPIISGGEDAGFLYVVMEGEVLLRDEGDDRQVISNLTEGHAFGWSALVPPYRYYLSAYCASRQCKLLKMERKSLKKLIESDPAIGYPVMNRILALIGKRFDEMEEKVIKRLGQDMIRDW